MTTPADTIRVPPQELQTLATRLSVVRSDLSSAPDVFLHDGEALHSALIEGALRDFSGAWSQRRDNLIKLLTGAETLLSAAATQFQQADAGLAAALAKGGGKPAPGPVH